MRLSSATVTLWKGLACKDLAINHYPHHIGDFNNATRHLTRVERALYRDLMDRYYDTERPLPGDDLEHLAKVILATKADEKAALKRVLSEFFILEDGLYHNSRCDMEITKYHALIATASKAGLASAAKRFNKKATTVKRAFNHSERSTNQNQNQNQNQEPNTSKTTPVAKATDPVKEEIWKTGKALLTANGFDVQKAGGFLGKLCKEYGQILVLQAVRDCVLSTPVEPHSWLIARCQERRQKDKGNGKFSAIQYINQQLAKSMDAGVTEKTVSDVHGEIQPLLPRSRDH